MEILDSRGRPTLTVDLTARGERTAKYNRLLQIADARPDLAYGLVEP